MREAQREGFLAGQVAELAGSDVRREARGLHPLRLQVRELGVGQQALFDRAIAIFVGVNLIHKEVDRRTVYTILSKPLTRAEFLLGKYFGLVATIWLQVAISAS